MAYTAAFDSSSLFWANELIKRLIEPKSAESTREMLSHIRRLDLWSRSEASDGYCLLNKLAAELQGMRETQAGWARGDIEDSRAGDAKVSEILQFTFGIICLSRVVEAICLADRIYYLGGTGYISRRLYDVAPWLCLYDDDQPASERVWSSLYQDTPKERQDDYVRWIRDGQWKSEKLPATLTWMAETASVQPYVNLASHLLTVSNGLDEHPVVFDMTHPFPGISRQSIGDTIARNLDEDPLHLFHHSVGLLKRAHGYLLNGLAHQAICSHVGREVAYWWNPVRSPFLGATCSQASLDSESSYRALLETILFGRSGTQKGEALSRVAVDEHAYVLFSAVLQAAKSTSDILPTAYRFRRDTRPIRDHVSDRGLDEEARARMEKALNYTERWLNVRAGGATGAIVSAGGPVGSLRLPVGGEFFALLVKPFFPMQPFEASVRVVRDDWRIAYSVGERLEVLHKGV